MFLSLALALALRETAVAAVADGMKAWEVMRERAYAFDLVLTEVVMPTLSGIQLLARIVAADECKNIPVISKFLPDFKPDRYFLLVHYLGGLICGALHRIVLRSGLGFRK